MFTFKTRSIGSVLALVVLVVALLIPSAALADEGVPLDPDAPAGEVTEADGGETADSVAAEATVEPVVEDPADEEPIATEETAEEAAAPVEDLAAVVELLVETDSVLVDETGEVLPLASEEAAEALTASDPWFDAGGGVIRGYSSTGVCAAVVTDCHPSPTPIQEAIDDPDSTGQIIHIESGIYNEQLRISKNVSLVGAGEGTTIIQAPSPLVGMNADPTIAAMVELFGGAVSSISNLTISGPDAPLGAPLWFGIYVGGDSTLNLSHVTVTNIHDSPVFTGAQHGVGIQVGRNANGQVGHAVIEDSTVVDYQKNGITVDNTGSTVIIRRTTVTGAGPTGITAQNGIQISRGATGTVEDSTITLNEYTGSGWSAAGILVWNAGDGVSILDNYVGQNQTNATIEASDAAVLQGNTIEDGSWGIYLNGSDGGSILNNTVQGALYDNIDVYVVDDATISGNQILNAGYDGLWIGDASNISITGNVFGGNGFVSGAPNAAAIHLADDNTLAGFVITGNSFDGNVNGIVNESLVNAVDATGNWWGDGSGPFDNSPVSDGCGLMLDNPLAGGNAVSPCVIYEPWLLTDPFFIPPGEDEGRPRVVSPATGGPLANFVILITGAGVELDCEARTGTELRLENGDHVVLPCPITGEATLQREEADTLPSELDAGMTYVSGLRLGMAPDHEATTALDGTIGLHFAIPAGQATEGLSILHLDGGVWQDLGGVVGPDGYFDAPHAQTGIYVLVSQ